MKSRSDLKSHALLIVCMLISLVPSQPARAGAIEDFAAIDFSLRFPSALAKFSSYADVAGFGGASAGSRYSTGVNPASTGWLAAAEHPYSVSPQYSRIRFDNGPTLGISSLAAGIGTEQMGSFQPAIARIRSDGRPEGDFLLLKGDYLQIQWGKKVSEDLAIGANVSASRFNTKAGLGGFLVADGNSDTTGVRAGILYAASKRLLVGLVTDYSTSRSKSDVFDPTCLCVVQVSDSSRSSTVRAGMSYEYAEQSSIYADYMHGKYRNSTGSMPSKALFIGGEHRFLPWLFGRAGIAYDLRGLSSQTMGIGVNPSKTISIDIAVQRDMFPELRPEFGRSRLLNVSVSLSL